MFKDIADLDNLDVMIGSEIIVPIEKDLASTVEGSTYHYDTESKSHPRRNSRE